MRKVVCILIVLTVYWGCKKPYLPVAISGNTNYLVVEGTINTGQDSTIIRVSRTVKLASKLKSAAELNATVMVEGDDNSTYPVAETGNGYYKTFALNLSDSHKYRLKITATDSKVYQSDFVPVKNSPPIDSVTYGPTTGGIGLFVNTHDASNKTTYYRWNYVETYIIHAAFHSTMKLVTVPFDTVVIRPLDEQVYECWRNDSSSNVILGSSAKLAQDVISHTQLTYVPIGSERMGVRYSILVTQTALTADAFNYWQNLKKNTEQLGSVFDAQPSEIQGNIHCVTNPSEPVIGYISAGTITRTRIFVDNRNLPPWTMPASGCLLKSYLLKDYDQAGHPIYPVRDNIYTGVVFPVNAIQPPGQPILGYTGTGRECADCTLRGTNKKPSFWVDD